MRFQTHLLAALLPLASSAPTLTDDYAVIAAAPPLAAPSSAFWPYQSYYSSPFHPPQLKITASGAPLSPGYLFFAQATANTSAPLRNGAKNTAPYIMTDTGELVWSGVRGTFAANFKVQSLRGKPVLTYWEGVELAGTNVGHYYGSLHVLDDSYQQIYRLCPDLNIVAPAVITQPCRLDAHESILTDDGKIIFSAYNITAADLSSIGGPADGYVWNNLFFVMDIDTKKILYSWSALDHVPVSTTKNPLGPAGTSTRPFDYFHLNSVEQVGDQWLVNARHTWSTYLLNNDGTVNWTLQGDTGGDFGPLPAGANFRWQHDARYVSSSATSFTFHMFNNYNAYQGNGTHPSNSLQLTLSLPPSNSSTTTVLDFAYADPSNPIYSDAQGNFLPLPDGNSFAFYGITPAAQEFGPTGDVRWSSLFGYPNLIQSYRMYKQNWTGNPLQPPSTFLMRAQGLGYVSWNGATEVATWYVYAGSSNTSLSFASAAPKKGFETAFSYPTGSVCVQVAAYDASGSYLRNSTVNCSG